MNTDDFNRAQSNYDTMTPADRRDPTDEDIRLYAEHIKPKLLASRECAGMLLSDQINQPGWDAFAEFMHAGHIHTARLHFSDIIERSADELAEQIASDELYGDADHSDTLHRIGADDWRTFFAKFNAERNA